MTLRKPFAKYLQPVLKSEGFEYRKPRWLTDCSKPWRTAIELTSHKLADGLWVFDVHIGLFSYEIDALTDAKARQFSVTRADLPLGVITCHFQTSIFSLTSDAEWQLRTEPGPFFDTEMDAVSKIKEISDKLGDVLPKLINRYANFEAIIRCKHHKIGTEAQSKKTGLFAAAACILLERYDEAQILLEESIRPGSSSYDKAIGEALSALAVR